MDVTKFTPQQMNSLRVFLLRQIIIASGFAEPVIGIFTGLFFMFGTTKRQGKYNQCLTSPQTPAMTL